MNILFKKIELWLFLLILILCFIVLIFFGATLKYHYTIGKNKFLSIQNTAVFLADIPFKFIDNSIQKTLSPEIEFEAHKNKKKFKNIDKKVGFNIFKNKKRKELLLVARYNGKEKKSVVEVIDLNTFSVLKTYTHNIENIISKVDTKILGNEKIQINHSPKRFRYRHPIIDIDGNMIASAPDGPLFKIDICNNLVWLNDKSLFHHSIEKDFKNNYWIPGRKFPPLKKYSDDKFYNNKFYDDTIVMINEDGKILYEKSIVEILKENNLVGRNILSYNHPIHLNDIQPVLKKTKYFKLGDLFLSLRGMDAILHYRPKENKILRVIKGPFFQQHDVDIVSDNQLSIFNNNNNLEKGSLSEIIIYDYELDSFKKIFNDELKVKNFKTETQGLADFFDDGSVLIEEQNHGRIFLINNDGKTEWEYVNKYKDKVYILTWSRLIKDDEFIKNFKKKLKLKKC